MFSPTGYIAIYDIDDHELYLPVIGADPDGYALVFSEEGRAVRAAATEEYGRFAAVVATANWTEAEG